MYIELLNSVLQLRLLISPDRILSFNKMKKDIFDQTPDVLFAVLTFIFVNIALYPVYVFTAHLNQPFYVHFR